MKIPSTHATFFSHREFSRNETKKSKTRTKSAKPRFQVPDNHQCSQRDHQKNTYFISTTSTTTTQLSHPRKKPPTKNLLQLTQTQKKISSIPPTPINSHKALKPPIDSSFAQHFHPRPQPHPHPQTNTKNHTFHNHLLARPPHPPTSRIKKTWHLFPPCITIYISRPTAISK